MKKKTEFYLFIEKWLTFCISLLALVVTLFWLACPTFWGQRLEPLAALIGGSVLFFEYFLAPRFVAERRRSDLLAGLSWECNTIVALLNSTVYQEKDDPTKLSGLTMRLPHKFIDTILDDPAFNWNAHDELLNVLMDACIHTQLLNQECERLEYFYLFSDPDTNMSVHNDLVRSERVQELVKTVGTLVTLLQDKYIPTLHPESLAKFR